MRALDALQATFHCATDDRATTRPPAPSPRPSEDDVYARIVDADKSGEAWGSIARRLGVERALVRSVCQTARVREDYVAHERMLRPKRRCRDRLPKLPPLGDEDPGSRAFLLLAHSLGGGAPCR